MPGYPYGGPTQLWGSSVFNDVLQPNSGQTGVPWNASRPPRGRASPSAPQLPAGYTGVYPKTATLTDNFTAGLDTTKWGGAGADANITVVSSQLNISLPSGAPHGSILVAGNSGSPSNPTPAYALFDLTESDVVVQLVNAGNQSLTSLEVLPINLTDELYNGGSSSENSVYFLLNQNWLNAYQKVNGTATNVAQGAWSSSTMSWFRIREHAGTVYFETGPDGITWNAWGNCTDIPHINQLGIQIQADTYNAESSSTTCIFDNVNPPIAGAVTMSATAGMTVGATTFTPPPWSIVQSVGVASTAANGVLTLSLSSTPTTGNKIIAIGGGTNASPPGITSVKDSNNVTLTAVGGPVNAPSFLSCGVWCYDVPATPSTTFTIQSTTNTGPAFVLMEVSGLVAGTTAALDNPAVYVSGASGTSLSGPSYSTNTAGELLLCILMDDGSGSTTTLPSGYTADSANINASGANNVMIGYKNSTGGSETTGPWTQSVSDNYVIFALAFKPSGPPPAWTVMQSWHGETSGGNPQSIPPNNLSAGTKILAIVTNASATVNPCTGFNDGLGHNGAQILHYSFPIHSRTGFTDIWAMDTPSGDVGTKPTFTLTYALGITDTAVFMEVSGLPTGATGLLDGTYGAADGGTTALSSPYGPPSYASSTTGELLLYIVGDTWEGYTTWVGPSGYTIYSDQAGGPTYGSCMVGYKPSTGGTETGQWSWTGGTYSGTFVMVALKVAAPTVAGTVTMAATAGATIGGVVTKIPSLRGFAGQIQLASTSTSGTAVAGLGFRVTKATSLTGFWAWISNDSAQPTTPLKFALWQETGLNTGTWLGSSATATGPTLIRNTWNYIPLATPFALTANTPYRAVTAFPSNIASNGNDYAAGGNLGNGITNGCLQIFSDPGGGLADPNGTHGSTFVSGTGDPTTTYPVGGTGVGFNFGLDVQVLAQPGDTVQAFPEYRNWPLGSPNGGGNYNLGTQFLLGEACLLTKIWFWSGSGSATLPTRCGIWNSTTHLVVTGTDNASPAWKKPDGTTASAGAGWVYVDYSSAGVTLIAGQPYTVSVYANSGPNWDTYNNYFASGQPWANGLVNGPMSMPGDTQIAGGNGTYVAGSWAFPNLDNGGAQVFVTPEVVVGAPTLVQEKTVAYLGQTAPYSVAFNSNVTAGDLLVCAVIEGLSDTDVTAITDTVGSTWRSAGHQTVSGLSQQSLWWAIAPGSGANTLSITNATTGWSGLGLHLLEFSGIASVTTPDATASNQGASGSVVTCPSFTGLSGNNDLVLYWNCHAPGSNTATGGVWTDTAEDVLVSGGLSFAQVTYAVIGTSVTGPTLIPGSTANYNNLAVAFRATGAAPAIETSPALVVSGFSYSGVNSTDTINALTFLVSQYESDPSMGAPTYQLWAGSTQIGTTQTGASTIDTANIDILNFPGCSYAQLSTLQLRIYANGPSGTTMSVDSVSLTVTTTPGVTGTVNLSGSAGMTIGATVTEAATVSMSAGAALTVVGTWVQQASIALSAASNLVVGSTVTEVAAVNLSGSASLTVTPVVTETATVPLAANASMTIGAAVTQQAAVAMAASTSLTTAATVTEVAAVSLAGSAGLSVATNVTEAASVSLSGDSILTVSAGGSAAATVNLSATAGATIGSVVTGVASVSMSAGTSLTTAASLTIAASVAMAANATLAVSPLVTQVASVAMTGNSSLDLATSGTQQGTVALSGTATLTIAASVTEVTSVSLGADAGLEVTGIWVQQASIALSATAGLTLSATVTEVGLVSFSASGVLAIAAAGQLTATVSLSADSNLVVAGTWVQQASIALAAAAGLTVTAAPVAIGATVAMSATAALVANPTLIQLGAVSMAAVAGLSVVPTLISVGAVAMSGATTLTVAGIDISAQGVIMSATGGLTFAATVTEVAAVALSGSAALSIAATVTELAAVTMSGSAAMVVTGTWVQVASVALSAGAALVVTGALAPAGVFMSAVAGLTVTASLTVVAAVSLTADSTLTTVLTRVAMAQVTMSANASLAVTAIRVQFSSVLLTGNTSLVADAMVLVVAMVAMTAESDLVATPLGTNIAAVHLVAVSELTAGAFVTEIAATTLTAAAALLIAATAVSAAPVPVTLLVALQTMTVTLSVVEQPVQLSVKEQSVTLAIQEQSVQPALLTMNVTPGSEQVLDPVLAGY